MSAGAGFELPFGIKPVNPTPVDTWSGPYYGTTVANACAVALSSIDIVRRFPTMEVRLIAGNQGYKYWFKNGVNDINLVEFVGGAGAPGATGASGVQGNIGATGASGVQGNIGATGASGVQGNIGATGASGVQGNIGATGASGIQGNIGATGASGVQGNVGATGASGVQGNVGATGASGLQGNVGATGASGDQGNIGATGLQGATGTSITIVGTLALTPGSEITQLNNPSNPWIPTLAAGNGVIDSVTGNLWVYNGTTWTNVGVVRGPQGATGASGAQGNIGATGASGLPGATGSTADVLPIVTNYLSSSNVLISSLAITDRFVVDNQLYYYTDSLFTQSGNYDEGHFLGKTKLTQNNIRLANVGENWSIIRNVNQSWRSIAISSDGKYIIAADSSSFTSSLYKSNDYGTRWETIGPVRQWVGVAMSSDGKHIAAIARNGAGFSEIFISNNYGDTWTPTYTFVGQIGGNTGKGVAMSSDGKFITALGIGNNSTNARLAVSNNYGNTWTLAGITGAWNAVSMSSDGRYQTAVVTGGQIYTSNNYGNTWTPVDSNRQWSGVDVSSDGKYQTAVVVADQIYISNNYGITWVPKSVAKNWQHVCISADGKYQVAVVYFGNDRIYISNDYGNTWLPKENNRNELYSAAISSDAKYIVVGGFGTPIYLSKADELIDGTLTVTNVSAAGTLFGRAQDNQLSLTSSNTVQNSAVTVKINTIEQGLSSLADPPNYIQPTAVLEDFTSTPFEVGQTVNQVLDVDWTQGSAGSFTNGILTRNGITVLTYTTLPQTFTVNEVTGTTAITYRNTINYNQGPILNNSLGYPDPIGRIAAGSKFQERAHRGFYKVFFGSFATLPTNATELRNLTGSKFDVNPTNPNQVITESEFGIVHANNILFVLPQPRVLTTVITQANEDITSSFTLTPTSIALPNNILQGYNYYRLTTVVPLNIPLITIRYS